MSWQIEPAGLIIGHLLKISLQRCLLPADGLHHRPPSSLGALPLGSSVTGELMIPLGSTESVWLGLSRVHDTIPVLLFAAIETRQHGKINLCSGRPWREDSHSNIRVITGSAIDGIPRSAGGIYALARCPEKPELPSCKAIDLIAVPSRHICSVAVPGKDGSRRKLEGAAPSLLSPRPAPESEAWAVEIAVEVQITFVNRSTFTQKTGILPPPPIDVSLGYGGWRLP
jgi:hypothetical protein